jgi:glycosyltransferase involved in cell wall biosynthesis
VVTAAAGLDEVARGLGAKKILRVPNGIDASRFEGELPPEPAEYAGWRGPVAVYVGAMAEWVDLSLVEACARARPDVLFALVGPGPADAAGFPSLANVRFLGRRPPEQIPAYLRNADAGLIPFRSSRLESLIARVNPLKLYEYLAAGLPVVSTRWAELERLASPARLCASTEEFVAALDAVLARPGDADGCREFARGADWSRRVAPLLDWAGAA